MRRRPAAAGNLPVRRRPAAQVAKEVSPEKALENFKKGKEVRGSDISPGQYPVGEWVKTLKAQYFQQPAQIAGRVVREHLEGQDRELLIEASGTQTEELLKFCTAQEPRPGVVRFHLCPKDCPGLRSNPDLVHVETLCKVSEPAVTWETNLEVEAETALLRKDEERWRKEEEDRKAKEAKEKEKEKASSSSSTKEKKEKAKKKKKKKKEKKEGKEKKEKKGESSSPDRKKKKATGKKAARKTQKACYGGTGMDPDYDMRRRLAKRVRKAMKKDKGSTESGDSKSEETAEEDDLQTLLADRNKIRRIHSLCPGLLSSMTLSGMRPHVTSLGGAMWDEDEHELTPIVSQYHRHFMSGKLQGSMSREAMTLAWSCDLLIQGRISEALDSLLQRLKGIEMISSGVPWIQAQQVEICPTPEPAMSSRAELQIAHKEQKLDLQAKGIGSGGDKGGGKGKNKGKEKGKDKGKKGKEKDTDNKKSWKEGD